MSSLLQNFEILDGNLKSIIKNTSNGLTSRTENEDTFDLSNTLASSDKKSDFPKEGFSKWVKIKNQDPMSTLENNSTCDITTKKICEQEFQPSILPENNTNTCKLFSVSDDNQLQAVLSPSIKSGIYRKIVTNNLEQNESNKSTSSLKDLENKLERLATEVLKLTPDKFKIYKNRNILVSKDNKQHKRFIYKILDPRSLGLHTPSSKISTNLDQIKRSVGRPRNSTIVKFEPKEHIIPVSITRSGRISKPKILEDSTVIPKEILKDTGQKVHLNEIKDKDFKYYKPLNQSVSSFEQSLETENTNITNKRTRNLSSDSQCPVCHKILLGKRMKKHFEAFPDHNIKNLAKAQTSVYELSLYKFLVNKIQLISGDDQNDQKTDLFLTELSDLIEQIQSRNSKLVQNTSGIHFVSSKLSKILGIPEGQYSININAIESVPDPIIPVEEISLRPLAQPPQPRLADYNLSISLDDTITAKLNLSDNIQIPSEESLLRTVNDLVHQDIKKIGDHDDISLNSDMLQLSQSNSKTTVINYDHASDNAVEALTIKGSIQQPMLDLSLDLFQFRSN